MRDASGSGSMNTTSSLSPCSRLRSVYGCARSAAFEHAHVLHQNIVWRAVPIEEEYLLTNTVIAQLMHTTLTHWPPSIAFYQSHEPGHNDDQKLVFSLIVF